MCNYGIHNWYITYRIFDFGRKIWNYASSDGDVLRIFVAAKKRNTLKSNNYGSKILQVREPGAS